MVWNGLRVFCVGNSCFFATVASFRVFCDGSRGRCFLQRSWWEGMFFATAGHVFLHR